MNDNEEKEADECKLAPTDSEGNTNLCCCYVLDPDGKTTDPCHLPVENCCYFGHKPTSVATAGKPRSQPFAFKDLKKVIKAK
jgi:hypothetical protein